MTSSLAIRHVAFEDLGTLAPVLDQSGIAPRYLDGWSPDLAHVDPVAPDLVVVLGGPIGVYEVAAYPGSRTRSGGCERACWPVGPRSASAWELS